MWLVAHTDLAAVLHDYTVFTDYVDSVNIFPPAPDADEVRSAMALLLFILPDVTTVELLFEQAAKLLKEGHRRIRQSAKCIATAISFLHVQGIRHKDLKPSQVLLSSHGLWVTDFGWSRDMSDLDQSTTSGGDKTTLKYQAPERANRLSCGWPEDIFALGCIFFEIGYATAKSCWPTLATARPWLERGWYFHAHLDEARVWLHEFGDQAQGRGGTNSYVFAELIMKMLAAKPRARPSLDIILSVLRGQMTSNASQEDIVLGGFCCKLCQGTSSQAPIEDLGIPLPTDWWRRSRTFLEIDCHASIYGHGRVVNTTVYNQHIPSHRHYETLFAGMSDQRMNPTPVQSAQNLRFNKIAGKSIRPPTDTFAHPSIQDLTYASPYPLVYTPEDNHIGRSLSSEMPPALPFVWYKEDESLHNQFETFETVLPYNYDGPDQWNYEVSRHEPPPPDFVLFE